MVLIEHCLQSKTHGVHGAKHIIRYEEYCGDWAGWYNVYRHVWDQLEQATTAATRNDSRIG